MRAVRGSWVVVCVAALVRLAHGNTVPVRSEQPAVGTPATPHVAVLGFDLHGLASDARPGFEASLEVGLSNAGWTVLGQGQTQELLAKAHELTPGCRMGPCLAAIGLVLHVPYVVHGSVEVRGAEFNVLLTLLDARNGDPVVQLTRSCAVCTVDEALVMLSAVGEKLGPPSIEPSRPVVPRPSPSTWRSSVGWSGLLLGALAVAAAVVADEHSSSRAAAPLFAGGFVAICGGALLLGADSPDSLDHPTTPAPKRIGIRMTFKW